MLYGISGGSGVSRVGGRAGTFSFKSPMGESMRQYIPVITLALVGAFTLAALAGVLLPSDNTVLAEHINAPTNNPPEFSENAPSRNVPENTPAGVNIGAPISASDQDGDTLTYTLGGTDPESFDIDESTGQLITKVDLDEEAKASYSVTVTVDDGREANSSTPINVGITVVDVDEHPDAPAPPVVTTGSTQGSETTTLEINWFPPENTGPDINDYDYRYKLTTETSWTVVENGTSTDTTATISPLEADTAYQVSVLAINDERDGTWSLAAVGTTNKEGNAAPVFSGTTADRSVAENTPSGQRVGAAVTAMDANSITLTYSLAGQDADSFDIEESTGQIMTKAALNHEAKGSYTVLVVVNDDGDGGSDVITVTISVTDVSERPSKPAAPTVEMVEDDPETSDDESTMMLKVSWVAPDTAGPAIDDYDVEYRAGTTGTFMDGPQGVAGTSTTIDSLDANTSYQVRVKANSDDEQDSLWSLTGTGKTNPVNNAPEFSTATLTWTVDENTPAGRNIGSQIRANDTDSGDTLTYSLEPDAGAECDSNSPDDVCAFDIDASTGQLKTKDALDYEAKATYEVTVTVTDRKGETDTIEVTITVQDEDEPPLAPSKPTVTANTGSPTDTLDVTWEAPNNTGRPDIDSYDVECRGSGCPGSSSVDATGRAMQTMVTGLSPYTRYEIRLRAINDEGDGPWVSGNEYTNKADNVMPSFNDGDATTREVAENTARGLPVGEPVEADDTDAADGLTYSLGGTHADLFSIDRDGQIRTKSALNFEAECSAADTNTGHEDACTYSVDVKVVDGNGGSDHDIGHDHGHGRYN